MGQRYVVLVEHSAVVPGIGPTRLYGGTVVDEDAYNVDDLVTAGFYLVPILGPGGDPTLVLTQAGWYTGGGGGVPSARMLTTAPPLAGGGDLSADRTFTLTIDGTLLVGGGALGVNEIPESKVTGLTTDLSAISAAAATASSAAAAASSAASAAAAAAAASVQPARAINTTAPITGGGDLSADRTIALAIDSTLEVSGGNLRRAALTGEVTAPAGSNALTVAQTELAGLKGLAANGIVERTGSGLYTVRTVGVGAAAQVPDRAAADTRYAQNSLITPAVMRPPWAAYVNITSNVSIGSTTCPAWYWGRAPKDMTTLDVRTKIVTVITGTTWCELAVATGPAPIPATGATLTVVGYYSTGVSGSPFNSTNPSTVTIPVSGGQQILAGDHLWLVFAKLSTGSPAFRASGAGDELSTGVLVDGGNVRPSLILGTPTAFAAGSTTANLMVFHVYI